MDPFTTPPVAPLQHPKAGIASFVIACVGTLIFAVAFIIAIAAGALDRYPNEDALIILGVVVMVDFLLSIVGAILGMIALSKKNTKKIFSILGTVFNGLAFLFFLIVFVIALVGAI